MSKLLYVDDEQYLYLHFTDVKQDRFRPLVRKFRQFVPTAQWLSEEGNWKVSKHYLPQVIQFAFQTFGPNSIYWLGPQNPQMS